MAVLSVPSLSCDKASATISNCENKSPLVDLKSSAVIPNCSKASFAMPVPLTRKSLMPTASVLAPLANASSDVPPNSAASRNAPKSSVEMKICLDSFPRLSIDLREALTNKPRPATPARPTNAVFILNTAFPTFLRLLPNALKTLFVRSLAVMS